jgi:pimeloyl-ACP methyl ester carboxylesterase
MRSTLSRRRLLEAAAACAAGATAVAVTPARARRPARDPAHFVFVHGAWHGAWCWYKVTAALEAAGHTTTALDLPSGGIDGTPAASVTLAAQAERVVALLDGLDAPVVLVGHSAGGPVISTVAEARPGKIAKLVYVTAYLLPNGASIASSIGGDPDSLITGNLVPLSDGTVVVRPEALRDVFYGACDDADVELARSLLKPIGLLTTGTPLAVGAAFASVRRFYVACRRDRAITSGFQQTMLDALPCEKVFTLNADHSPFFSRPAALVRALSAVARA